MEKNCNLMLRGKTYYLRISVPRMHQSRLGKEIWKSLKTSNRDVAHILSGKHISEYHARLDSLSLAVDDLNLVKARETAEALGSDYVPAAKLKQQATPELLTTLLDAISTLQAIKSPTDAQVIVMGGAIPEQLSLDEMLTRYKELADAKWLDLDDRARDKKWNRYANPVADFEPRRLCRRPFGLSYAAIAGASSMAWYRSSASAGGMFPMGSRRRRLLNQSTHSSVANSTASKLRHGPRRWMTSAL